MDKKKYEVTYDIVDKDYNIIGFYESTVFAINKEDAFVEAINSIQRKSSPHKSYMPFRLTENDARNNTLDSIFNNFAF